MTKRFINYFRVSTQEQGRSGLGLEAQERAVKEITNNGIVIESFTEIESGKKNNRPILQKAINMCKLHDATLVVAKLDRLSRNVYFVSSLMESKVKFICADFKEVDNFTLHIFASLAERERKMISERTKAGLSSIKKNIEKNGFHISKNGNAIKSLGNQMKFSSEEAKSDYYRNIANQREYKLASDIGADLARALKQNGMKVPQIKEQLEKNGIILCKRTIYNYIK